MRKPLVALLLLLVSSAAAAADSAGRPNIVFSAGAINVLHHGRINNTAGMIEGQYRWGEQYFWVSPVIGAFGATDGSAMVFGGIYKDFWMSSRFTITPFVTMGAYHEGGGSDLGGVFQFYTGGDFMYRLDNDWRVGVALRHISNLGLHRGRGNPGTEIVLLQAAVPLK